MNASKIYAALIILSWVVFFLFQVLVLAELPITVLAIVFSALLLWNRQRGEGVLFVTGLLIGLVIEVGLGFVARTQHWDYASFFGVPFWLPIMWGYGFVAMRRIGNIIVESFNPI